MKTYQVEIKETLCMTVEIEAENAQCSLCGRKAKSKDSRE
ncbi:MAG: hypothetical protein GX434_17495 [Peptococcaceae bacterium]|nr:hypothetical protein [Peptococcaceae bacterium]